MTSTPVPGQPVRGRLTSLDLLRFLAALAVLFFHFIGTVEGSRWEQSTRDLFPGIAQASAFGHWGVQLFFVVSGFVILMSAWGRSLRDFVASRIARLFPAYWVSVLFAGVVFTTVFHGSFDAVDSRGVLLNLTMIQQAFGVEHSSVVYWTLWVELRFYLIIGLLLALGLTYGRVVTFIALWPFLAALVPNDGGLFDTLMLSTYAAYFAGGMGLYLIYAYGHSWVRWGLVGLNVAIATGVTGLGTPASTAKNVDTAVVVLLFAAVAVATLTPARRWAGDLGTRLGRLTYPLYLVHAPIGALVITRLDSSLSPWSVMLIAIVASLVMAWLINRYVERPLSPKVRYVVAKGLVTPTSATATAST